MADEIEAGASALGAGVSTSEAETDGRPPQLDHPALRDTGNEASVSYEEALLQEHFGDPDENGVYGKGGDQ